MKTNLHILTLAAALMLPTVVAIAADKETKDAKEQPRPAQESRSGATTGKDATKPAESAPTPVAPAPAKVEGKDPAPAPAKENAKEQPRPAQESRSGATTGRDATKSPETPATK